MPQILIENKRPKVRRVLFSLQPVTVERFYNAVPERERSKTVNQIIDEYLNEENREKAEKIKILKKIWNEVDVEIGNEFENEDPVRLQKEVWEDVMKKYF
ncbi:hypothetical protein A2335_02580 [Candidatus Peregrinibacteria bacterium RIFOXYB2_FULL_32_7]|nr:MAG: hypothetical protein A2335_02580 [Candidatus Peregrinibacteria bacterium RIFOXYB2_FULL_32_7]